MKKLFGLALLLCLLCTAALAEEEALRVGMECNYAPFNWTQPDASESAVKITGMEAYAGGYDVAIAQKLAEGLGRKLEIVKIEWDGLIPALMSGKIDVVIAGMSPTAERKVTVDFTDAYYRSDLVVVVRKDSPYAEAAKLSDFAGARVTAQLNTFHYTVIPQIEGVKIQTAMPDFPAMIVALNSGKIDGYISERPGAMSALASNPDFAMVTFEEGQGFVASDDDVAIAVAVVKGQEALVEQINALLAQIPQEERIALMDAAILGQPLLDE